MTSTRQISTSFCIRMMVLILFFPLLHGCREEPVLWKPDSEQMVIGEYIEYYPELYSEFGKLVEMAGMEALLKIRGPYTVFLVDNEAMMEYYSMKGVGGLEDLGSEFCEQLCWNHFVPGYITTGDIGLGALPFPNGLDDRLSSEFVGSDIIISKSSRIIDRDIFCSNGVIQLMDRVLDPITQDIFTVVSSDPAYAIFSEGLRRTGLMDTLQVISFPFGNTEARNYFTVLAVPDSIYRLNGINNVDELIAWCVAQPDTTAFMDDPFFRYMEYHCIHGSHYLSDLETGPYPILSRDNNVYFTIDSDYKMNLDKKTGIYTGFNVPVSNTPAKNGALHAVNDMLPPVTPRPTTMLFETTDFFDVKQGDYYLNHFQRFFDGENTFAKVKWWGDFLQYYYHFGGSNMQGDCWAIQQGWWEVSITFPKVMKGRYEIVVGMPNWDFIADADVSIDGVYTDTYRGKGGTGQSGPQVVGEVEFETTAEHTVTLRNVINGMLFWDYVEFVALDN